MERKCVRRSTVKQLQKTNKLTNPIKNNSSAKPDKKQSQNKANSIGLAWLGLALPVATDATAALLCCFRTNQTENSKIRLEKC